LSTTAVYGVATPYAWDVVETLTRLGLGHLACVDNLGGADPDLPGLTTEVPEPVANVALGPASARARAATATAAVAAGVRRMDAVVDPTAAVASSSTLGHGVFVNALVAVGARTTVGCFTNLNRSASIGHHCDLGAFTSTGPGVVLCGGVRTGTGAFLGAGAVVLPERSIGIGAVVGAGAVVTRDVPDGVVVTGNPARIAGDAPAWDLEAACPLC
jgi:sugar O-acyltransferase (sialic acid O-acetyltransferase NeuD family)